eukprot:scaffold27769_cov176-Amphora_coffeaeformis.AAC.2
MKTFVISLSAVAKAAALACTGVYLHRRGFVSTPQAKEMLSRYSQQIGLPCLFFSKIVVLQTHSSGGSSFFGETPAVGSDYGSDGTTNHWVLGLLALWPVYVVTCGLLVGHVMASTMKLPTGQRRAVLVATAFANSTGLPTTLLSMMTATTSDDPTRFLSIYLILYPILQWGIGGTLLGLDEPANVSNSMVSDQQQQQRQSNDDDQHNRDDGDDSNNTACLTDEEDAGLLENENSPTSLLDETPRIPANSKSGTLFHTFWSTARRGLDQPPVIGALAGWLVMSTPFLAKLWTEGACQWLGEAIKTVGGAAIPINMAVLGINLSMTFSSGNTANNEAGCTTDRKLLVFVTLGKLVVMPTIGLLSVWILRLLFSLDPSIAMVMSLVCCTPTANNIIVMTDLSQVLDLHIKQGMASMIATQYVVAPALLSLWVMLILHISQAR